MLCYAMFIYLQGVRPRAVDPIYHPRVERSCAECVPRGAFQDDAPKGRRGSGTGHGDGLRFRPFVLPQTVQLVSGRQFFMKEDQSASWGGEGSVGGWAWPPLIALAWQPPGGGLRGV